MWMLTTTAASDLPPVAGSNIEVFIWAAGLAKLTSNTLFKNILTVLIVPAPSHGPQHLGSTAWSLQSSSVSNPTFHEGGVCVLRPSHSNSWRFSFFTFSESGKLFTEIYRQLLALAFWVWLPGQGLTPACLTLVWCLGYLETLQSLQVRVHPDGVQPPHPNTRDHNYKQTEVKRK